MKSLTISIVLLLESLSTKAVHLEIETEGGQGFGDIGGLLGGLTTMAGGIVGGDVGA